LENIIQASQDGYAASRKASGSRGLDLKQRRPWIEAPLSLLPDALGKGVVRNGILVVKY
jgi:hypothetical protein